MQIAEQFQVKDYTAQGEENTQYMQLPDNEQAILLKSVTITGNNNTLFYDARGNTNNSHTIELYTITTPAGSIIIPNREDNFYDGKSIDTQWGKKELEKKTIYLASNLKRFVSYIIEFDGISEAREFYPADYSKDTTGVPDYQSTIYWKHQLKISSTKDTELSFYTSDITGRFKIIIQGITSKDVTYGEATFNVVKPK